MFYPESLMFSSLRRRIRRRRDRARYCAARKAWVANGAPVPPPHEIKRNAILACSRDSDSVFVETGTYMGEMTEAMCRCFSVVHTVELSPEIYAKTRARLSRLANARFHCGDSATVLKRVIADIAGPIVFWLDGHYSGGITAQGEVDTPVWHELEAIKDHPDSDRHVVLVDDARCFCGEGEFADYPTVEQVQSWVNVNLPSHLINVEDDVIRILPSQ